MEEKAVYTTREAAKYLGISTSTIYRMEKQGLISSMKTPGGQRRFSKEIIDKYLKESQNFEAPQNPSRFKKTDFMIREAEATYGLEVLSITPQLYGMSRISHAGLLGVRGFQPLLLT